MRVKYILDSDFVGKLKSFKLSLTISPYMDHYIFSRYSDNVYAAMSSIYWLYGDKLPFLGLGGNHHYR